MFSMYIDEKGPQETFKVSEPFNWREKIAFGTDAMHGYVGNIICISNEDKKNIENEYLMLENSLLSQMQNPKKELKGKLLLKGRFKYGVVSMRPRDVKFYIDLLNLLLKYNTSNLTFSVNKMSVIVDSILLEWIYMVEEKNLFPNSYLLKYIITKYLDVEASEKVIKSLIEDKNPKNVLCEIQKHMNELIVENEKNERMGDQIGTYKLIVELIDKTKNMVTYKSKSIGFDWDKVAFALDLWLTERRAVHGIESETFNMYLDEGIRKEYFESLNLGSIHEGCKSDEVIGLRITDLLVVLIGNYIKMLRMDNIHDPKDMTKVKRVSEKWFDLSEQHFELIKLLKQFVFPGDMYSFVLDTYFDNELNFEAFVEYIDSFDSFDQYKKVINSVHVLEFFEIYRVSSNNRWRESISNNALILKIFGSTRNAVSLKILRPL